VVGLLRLGRETGTRRSQKRAIMNGNRQRTGRIRGKILEEKRKRGIGEKKKGWKAGV